MTNVCLLLCLASCWCWRAAPHRCISAFPSVLLVLTCWQPATTACTATTHSWEAKRKGVCLWETKFVPLYLLYPPALIIHHLITWWMRTVLFSRSKQMEITFPIYKKENKERDYHTVDGLSFLTEDIVGEYIPSETTHLWNPDRPCGCCYIICLIFLYGVVLQPLRTLCTIASICGAGVPPKVRNLTGRPWKCQLWFWLSFNGPPLRSPTCLLTPVQVVGVICFVQQQIKHTFSVLLCILWGFLFSGRGYIVCGDDKGRLWTYHVTDLQKSNFEAGKPIQPTEVFTFSSSFSLSFSLS